MATKQQELTAENLKEELWTTLNNIQSGAITPATGDAIACQAREILRTVKTQLQIASQAKRPVTAKTIAFAEN